MATAPVVGTGVTSLTEYKSYTFNTSASDPDIGDTIASCKWNFGDGSAPVIVTTAPFSAPHSFNSVATFTVTVTPTDSRGVVGNTASTSFSVDSAPNPFATTAVTPPAAYTQPIAQGQTVNITFSFTVNYTGSGNVPLSASSVVFTPGNAVATSTPVITPGTTDGVTAWTVSMTYPSGANIGDTYTASPTVTVQDSLGVQSQALAFPAITFQTVVANPAPPSITITSPSSPSTSVFTSVTTALGFTLTDPNGNPVAYTVDWGDGTAVVTNTVTGDTTKPVPVALTHVFPDSFTGVATTVVTATNNLSANSSATPKKVTFNVTYNTYPTATLTSPQASATVPAAVAALGIPATDPPVVVLPLNGKINFSGTSTPPGGGDPTLTYLWDFQGGVPASSDPANPGEVTFAGTPNQITKYLVQFTVVDIFGRSSANGKNVDPRTYKRWVIVDGYDSEVFTLSFLYRQRSGTIAPDTYTYAQQAEHGNGATVTLFQDGVNNTYAITNSSGASATIPVRSDVPFWLSIPSSIVGDASDSTAYQFNVPNAHGVDPDLEGTLLPRNLALSEGTTFAFQSATYPWNPQFQVVTGSGFGPEGMIGPQRRFQGGTEVENTFCYATGIGVPENNLRWLDRLSVPTTDPLPVIQFAEANNIVGNFSGIQGYQLIPEWFVFLKATATVDYNTNVLATAAVGAYKTASAPTDLGFIIDDSFQGLSTSSEHLAVTAMEAFRAPRSSMDPYDFDVMRANITSPFSTVMQDVDPTPNLGLNPTPLGSTALTFLSDLTTTSSRGALSGGITSVTVPYDANDMNRVPTKSATYNAYSGIPIFGYAEYLWTKAWRRPLVLNRTSLNSTDTQYNLGGYQTNVPVPAECADPAVTLHLALPWFFYSNPTGPWPSASNVSPDGSSYDLNVTNGGTFDASSPVTDGNGTGTRTGVGRFFWTAFTPHYNADSGAIISRTWLAGTDSQIPSVFNTSTTDALTAWGFMPPQDTMVDKRSRNADGSVSGELGGYRVLWYNPTKDQNGDPVPPDFWAVQVVADSTTYLYLVSANYPRVPQLLSNSLLTDSRTFLPSGKPTYQNGDIVAPGYCWFDIPPEVRPKGGTATVTVFGLKSILKNNAVAGARAINRAEWIEAVKTVTASISTKTGGFDTTFAHKIPFNYPWDIVVVNGAATPVAP